ncbi:MAG: hypothetical protein QXF36_07385 [Candidatus Caldarchaeum sp.]
MRHVISAKQFDFDTLADVFSTAKALKNKLSEKRMLKLAVDRILMTVFLEPSTRTRLSFVYAMKRLGGDVVDFGPEEVTSRAKGESFEDTMRMLDGYAPDVIVLRSREVGFDWRVGNEPREECNGRKNRVASLLACLRWDNVCSALAPKWRHSCGCSGQNISVHLRLGKSLPQICVGALGVE